MSTKEQFPDFFPEGCPPEDSIQENIEVYRMIVGENPNSADFKSFHELGRTASKIPYPFMEYGLSVNKDLNELKKIVKAAPVMKKKFKNIARGVLSNETGVIKHTPTKQQKNHITWWMFKDINACNYFNTVKEGGAEHE